jgi:hypothetical protein
MALSVGGVPDKSKVPAFDVATVVMSVTTVTKGTNCEGGRGGGQASFTPTLAGGLLKLDRNATIFACESPFRVKTRIYRVATLTPASPQSADMPRQAQALPYSSNLCWGLVLAGILIPIAFAESEPA